MMNMRVSIGQDSTERFVERAQNREGCSRGGAVLLQGPFLSLLLWDSRRGGMHQGLTAGWEGQHPFYPHCVPSLGSPCGYAWDLEDTQSLSLGLSCHCPGAECLSHSAGCSVDLVFVPWM